MARRVLDTSVLIHQWRLSHRVDATVKDARAWAAERADVHGTRMIVPPVEIEFLAGVRSRNEMRLAEAFLACFTIPANGDVKREDWDKARQYAKRVPPDGKPRHLGGCLILAVTDRIGADPVTFDKRFFR